MALVPVLLRTVLALMASASLSVALAQTGNATAGAPLFSSNCKSCHYGDAYLYRLAKFPNSTEAQVLAQINTNIANQVVMRAIATLVALTPLQRADIAAHIATAQQAPPMPPFALPPGSTPPPPSTITPPVASPNPAIFGNTSVGSTSAVVQLLFTNTTSATVTFADPAVTATGGDTGDFLNSPSSATGPVACLAAGSSLAPGMTCSFGAQFKPTVAGTRSATWTVNFMGGVAARTLTLSGTATASVPAPAPAPAPAPT
ncbi:MAG: hypothetical protein ACREBN_01650, partial [Burkholderiaceae bacterium]